MRRNRVLSFDPGVSVTTTLDSTALSAAPDDRLEFADHVTLRRLRGWSARHPVTAFLTMGFAIAYPVMALPILASHGVIADGWMPQCPGPGHRADRLRPAGLRRLAACRAVGHLCRRGPAGRPGLVRRICRWRIGATWRSWSLPGFPR